MTTHHYPNSLVNRITDLVCHRGKATLSEVVAEFPDQSRKQVHAALCNARDRKLLKVILRGSFRGRRESVWAPEVERPNPIDPTYTVRKEKPKAQPVASVWELGTPAIQEWPPTFEGGRSFCLLGPWDSEGSASNDSRKAA